MNDEYFAAMSAMDLDAEASLRLALIESEAACCAEMQATVAAKVGEDPAMLRTVALIASAQRRAAEDRLIYLRKPGTGTP